MYKIQRGNIISLSFNTHNLSVWRCDSSLSLNSPPFPFHSPCHFPLERTVWFAACFVTPAFYRTVSCPECLVGCPTLISDFFVVATLVWASSCKQKATGLHHECREQCTHRGQCGRLGTEMYAGIRQERKGQLKESAKIVQRIGDKSWESVVILASSM